MFQPTVIKNEIIPNGTLKYRAMIDNYRTELKKKQNEKVQCECGETTHRSNLENHRRSKSHLEKMQQIKKKRQLKISLKKLE